MIAEPVGVRAANRAFHERNILETATRILATKGAAGLTLRGVAAEVGMAPSAIYRYYAGIDALLTALIIESYTDVAAAARATLAPSKDEPPVERALAACRAVRAWAHANPHRYALIYGSPVPDYRAPEDTIGPASGVGEVLIETLRTEAGVSTKEGAGMQAGVSTQAGVNAGRSTGTQAGSGVEDDEGGASNPDSASPPGSTIDSQTADALGIPPGVAVAAIRMWTALFGMISFELFGHWNNVVADPETFFDAEIRRLAQEVAAAHSA